MLIMGRSHRRTGDSLAKPDRGTSKNERPTVLTSVAIALLALASLTVLALVAHDSGAEGTEYDPAGPWTFRSEWGWYEGDRIEYYDLGRASNTTSPAYRLVDASGKAIEGQHLIFSNLRPGILVGAPFDSNYSDFHRILDVQVPAGYVPDTIRSLSDISEANLTMVQRDLVWNTPMVPAGSTLSGTDSQLHPLIPGWWNGSEVFYFRFESSVDTSGLFDPGSGIVRDASALGIFDPPGQLQILETYPGQVAYSPLTRLFNFIVNSAQYVADTVRSWDEAVALDLPTFPEGNLYNRPVVGAREAIPRFEQAGPATYDLREAWWNETAKILYYEMGAGLHSISDIYRFVTSEGAPILAQHYLVEHVAPGVLLGEVSTEGYSPIWRFHDIVVEDETSFEPDIIKSMEDVRRMGFTVNETDEFLIAPMITKGAKFLPSPSKPPGTLVQVWYDGTGVFLDDLGYGSTIEVLHLDDLPETINGPTIDIIVLVDDDGVPYPDQQPILGAHPGLDGYSPYWRVVHASGGEGYQADRFRSRAQLVERGWTLNETPSDFVFGGFVAGPLNTPAWKPLRFTFTVGPIVDGDGQSIKKASVRVSRGVEVVEGLTDADGMVAFEVNSTWNGKTVQVFVSKEGYDTVTVSADIDDYEDFRPAGGFVPWLQRQDSDTGLESGTMLALGGVLIIAVLAFLFLMRSKEVRAGDITEAEADAILSGDVDSEDDSKSDDAPERT